MTTHTIGTHREWLAARVELLDPEKEHMRQGDELARRRQELPWVPVEKEYVFETESGRKTLAELFDGRSQLRRPPGDRRDHERKPRLHADHRPRLMRQAPSWQHRNAAGRRPLPQHQGRRARAEPSQGSPRSSRAGAWREAVRTPACVENEQRV
jgi:hypothetical protein